MISHLVVFTFNPGVARTQADEAAAALRELTADMPYVVRYECGPALGIRQGADFGVLAIVRTPEDVETYLDDPRHVAIVRERITPIVATRSAVQLELTGSYGD
jgi:hypothetical protein